MSLTVRISVLIVVAVLVAVGLAVALAFLPLLVAIGVLAALGVLSFREVEPRLDSTRFGCAPERFAVRVAGAVVVGCYAAIGMTAVAGGAAAALTAATALTLLGRRRLRRRRTRRDEHPARAGDASEDRPPHEGCAHGGPGDTIPTVTDDRRPLPTEPAALSVDDLCRAWRVSYLRLQDARGPGELEHVVRLRRDYLDELARRHPKGFRRWLDHAAHAGGDPFSYVRDRSSRPGRGEEEVG
jgi:hypothetical protein